MSRLFTIPSPLGFLRGFFDRATPAAIAPTAFDGTIVVVSPPAVAALPRPALVTPYGGHRPTVARGLGGRFRSVRGSVLVATDLESVARVSIAWLTSEARKGASNPALLDPPDAARAYVLRALDSVHVTSDEAGTLLVHADAAHSDARETLIEAACALLNAARTDEDTSGALDTVRLACRQAMLTRAVRLALRDRNTGRA